MLATPTSVFNKKFANLQWNQIMIGTHLLLLGFGSIKCFSMHPRLFIERYVMSAVSV